jgi:hypothetical protein
VPAAAFAAVLAVEGAPAVTIRPFSVMMAVRNGAPMGARGRVERAHADGLGTWN